MTDRNDTGMVRVWDPVVRYGHWFLAVGFATAYLTEGEPLWLHTWAGYAIAAAVALRVVWGFVGPQRARFSDFVTGPDRVVAYLKALLAGKADRYVGHSPAGGAMTVALLATLALTAFAGMGTLAAEEGKGPLAGYVTRIERPAAGVPDGGAAAPAGEHDGRRQENVWKEAHELLANLALVLIILHLGGVVLASRVHRENLARSMVTGLKRP